MFESCDNNRRHREKILYVGRLNCTLINIKDHNIVQRHTTNKLVCVHKTLMKQLTALGECNVYWLGEWCVYKVETLMKQRVGLEENNVHVYCFVHKFQTYIHVGGVDSH